LCGFVARERPQLNMSLVHRLPSHRAPIVPCSPSLLVLGVSFFALADVALARVVLFGLLGFCFILKVFVHEGLVARES